MINSSFVPRPIHIHIPIRHNVLHWVIEEAGPREGKQLVRGHTARPRTEEVPIRSCYLFFLFIYLLWFWLHWVFVAACRRLLFSCGAQDLIVMASPVVGRRL